MNLKVIELKLKNANKNVNFLFTVNKICLEIQILFKNKNLCKHTDS